MSDDEKKPEAPKEEEPKQPDSKVPRALIIDTTDKHPPGWGVSM